eukprot:PhM_4_TR3055/c2_g2_i1/m.97877
MRRFPLLFPFVYRRTAPSCGAATASTPLLFTYRVAEFHRSSCVRYSLDGGAFSGGKHAVKTQQPKQELLPSSTPEHMAVKLADDLVDMKKAKKGIITNDAISDTLFAERISVTYD